MEFQWFSTKWKYAILSQRLLTRPTSVLDSTCHLLLLGRLQVSHYRMFHFDCYLSVCHGMTQSAQTSLWTWFLSRRWNLKGHDISQKWTHPNQQAATDEYTRNHLSQDVCARPQEEKRKLSTVTARLLTQCQHYPVTSVCFIWQDALSFSNAARDEVAFRSALCGRAPSDSTWQVNCSHAVVKPLAFLPVQKAPVYKVFALHLSNKVPSQYYRPKMTVDMLGPLQK